MWNKFVVICQDGSREEVIAENWELSTEPGVGAIVTFEPNSSYRNRKQGVFINPQGVHRVEEDVEMPGFDETEED